MKRFFLLLPILLFSNLISAQPSPCLNPMMTPLCQDACVICDINGFTGRNDSQVISPKPDDFCTRTAHNITWIAFIAGTTNLVLDVFVSNCENDRGLEVGIYETLDCETMRLVSNCNGSMDPNRTARFTTTEPLVVGQYYYFVMDGNRGDICDYTVTVVSGSTLVGELDPINLIDGPDSSCPGDTLLFSVLDRPGANFKDWTIDGITVQDQSTVLEYTFENPGEYEICYSAYNVCDTIPEICKTVNIRPLPTIFRRDTVCESECFYFSELDTLICNPGSNTIEKLLPSGCTQKYLIELEIRDTPSSDLELEFCLGDSIKIGDEYFHETGNYTPTLTSRDGCDSLIRLSITTFLCDINGGFSDDNLKCPGDSNGTLSFNLLDGAFPYQYVWEEKTGTGLTGSGVSNSQGDVVVIPGLSAGIYSVTVTDADNSRGVFVGQIFEPAPFYSEISYSDFSGYGVSCAESEDGWVSLLIEGGSPEYSYIWDNSNSESQTASDLSSGNYSVSITDASGCELVLSPELRAPDPISATLRITEPECNPDDSGIIEIIDFKGGVGPFETKKEDETYSGNSSFGSLFPGDYQITLRDFNGCEITVDTTLAPPDIPNISLNNYVEIFLGDSIELTAQSNFGNLNYNWSGSSEISCPDCPMTFVKPTQNSTYYLVATLPNRCEQSDSVYVKIIDRRRVYVPSAFSPNNDGINDFLPIFGGPEVARILDFQVYARWGELLYKAENFQPNNSEFGWSGKFRGNELDPGVYVWIANVEFIDGKTKLYEGDISLLR